MVSAPATNWTCFHSRPASSSAARAAATPYSTKLRPHLPQGCMPTPRIATSCAMSGGPPLPDHVLGVRVFVERREHELHLHAGFELLDGRAVDLAEHDHLLGLELDGGNGVGHERIRRDVRLGRLVAVVRERPE